MRPWSAVVYVTKYVQLVDGQTLNNVANGHDKIVGTPCADYRFDNTVYISGLVRVVNTFVQQLLYNIFEVGWQ